MLAPSPLPDEDRPATRRDLQQFREVVEANVRAEFASFRAEIAERFAAYDAKLGAFGTRLATHTRTLVLLNVLMSSGIAALVLRNG